MWILIAIVVLGTITVGVILLGWANNGNNELLSNLPVTDTQNTAPNEEDTASTQALVHPPAQTPTPTPGIQTPASEPPTSRPEQPSPTPMQQIEDPPPKNPLVDTYIAMLSGDSFYMQVRMKTGSYEVAFGSGVEMTCDIARQAGMLSINFKDYDMQIIVKGNRKYTIIHSMNAIIKEDASDGYDAQGLVPETDDLEFVRTGIGTIFDKTMPYEAYSSQADPDTEIRFFADDLKLIGIQSVEDYQITMTMEILEISKDIPPGMFDIPEDYQLIQ